MNRRERKKEETRSNIIKCAADMFKEKGFNETSMEEIAEKSDVSKGTLYNYFEDKESILSGYFKMIISDYGLDIKESLKDTADIKTRLYKVLEFINGLFKNDLGLAEIYFKYRMQTRFDLNFADESKRSGIEKFVLEIIKEGQSSGQLRDDIPSLILTRNFQFLTMSFFISSIYTKEPIEIETIKYQLVELFLNGAKK